MSGLILTEPAPNVTMTFERACCYPMEFVRLYVQAIAPNLPNPTLHIYLPSVVVEPEWTWADGTLTSSFIHELPGDDFVLSIPLKDRALSSGRTVEAVANFRLNSLKMNHYLTFSAWTGMERDWGKIPENAAHTRLAVKMDAAYMKYLPELYQADDFMARFLMLFESFWRPIQTQIAQADVYFDPDLTPEKFLPYLSSWVGLDLDEKLPPERARRMIRAASEFYRCRGTMHSLRSWLELFTDGKVYIEERRAKNMVLGAEARLGAEIALGSNNQPNTIFIHVEIKRAELERVGFTPEMYRRKIASIARDIIPAHAVFDVTCDYV